MSLAEIDRVIEKSSFLNDRLSDSQIWRSDGTIAATAPWTNAPTTPNVFRVHPYRAIPAPHSAAASAEISVATSEAHLLAQKQRSYAVRYLAIANVLMYLAMSWCLLTGWAFATDGFWLDPAVGVFGIAGFAWIGISLMVAGRTRRA